MTKEPECLFCRYLYSVYIQHNAIFHDNHNHDCKSSLGTGQGTKTSKEGEEVIFNKKKLYCRFWTLIQGFKVDFLEKKKLQYGLTKMVGESFGIFPKIHPFWRRHPSLFHPGSWIFRHLLFAMHYFSENDKIKEFSTFSAFSRHNLWNVRH